MDCDQKNPICFHCAASIPHFEIELVYMRYVLHCGWVVYIKINLWREPLKLALLFHR